jgi:alpha-N-arabinofuranosidase
VKSRRRFLKESCTTVLSSALAAGSARGEAGATALVVDPKPLFEISPYLYMQFMEPLGVTDGSVEAAWDYDLDDWRQDFVALVRDLEPGAIRFGGLFSRYYRWREGVGPVASRPSMRNYVWGGMETNRVGTGEFISLCKRVGAAPLICVNFLSDGRKQYWRTKDGQVRTGDAEEAADWVSYANDPDNKERKRHGVPEPYGIQLWQLGNETSYGNDGFTEAESIQHTIEFADAMKRRDPSIQLIGWGDRSGGNESPLWADELLERAGDRIDYVAIHMMQQAPRERKTALTGFRHQRATDQAWAELMEIAEDVEERLRELEQVLADRKLTTRIAVTEGHLSLRPRNRNLLLLEWLSGVYHARVMNIYQRHGAHVKIATAADFCGTRWTTNAVMIPVPTGTSYLTPAGAVMRLFKKHNGKRGVALRSCPSDLDVAASRSADSVYLHVANLNLRRSVTAALSVSGMTITGGRVFEIAPSDLLTPVDEERPDMLPAQEKPLSMGPKISWCFPGASVSAVELSVRGI